MEMPRRPFFRLSLPFGPGSHPRANGQDSDAPVPATSDVEEPLPWASGSDAVPPGGASGEGRIAADAPDDNPDDDPDVVHDVLKRTDVWFAYHATALDREASQLAELHAAKGQPRHDMERDGPLEMELLLEQQAREVIWGWADRVKRKMQGAIAAETERVGEGIAAARQSVANADAAREAIGRHMRSTAVRVGDLRMQLESWRNRELNPALPAETIESERHLGNGWFWPLMVLLVFADFFANVPVFTELFPANNVVDAAFAVWEEEILARDLPSWFGVAHLLKRIAIYPESSILALSVIIFFVFLGHSLGGSLRSLVVLWKNRRDEGFQAIGSAFRQAGWPAALSLVGICLTIFVLYEARARVLPMTEMRVTVAQQELGKVREELAALQAQSLNISPDLFTREAAAQENVRGREQRVDYARAIDGMNFPIALLNGVLVIAAVIAGYLRERRTFSVSASSEVTAAQAAGRRADAVQGELSRIQAELEGYRAAFVQRRQAAHDSLLAVGTALLRAEHLLETDLLRDWYGKAERVRRAVPIFRTVNARLRGLDVEDIVAFRTPFIMGLPSPEELATALDRSPALAAYRDEHLLLWERLNELDRETIGGDLPALAGDEPAAHRSALEDL